MTGPSHFSMFTGRFPQEHGARINGVAVPIDSRWLTFPQVLRGLDYQSAAFVSAWPLKGRLTQLDQRFDSYDEELTRSYQLLHSSRWAEDVAPSVISWLNDGRDPNRPFLLWAHYFDPHSPNKLRQDYADLEQIGEPSEAVKRYDQAMAERVRRYDSEIGYVDEYIGKTLDTLDALGLRDSTLVVLVSDHGESLGEHGYVGHGRRLTENTIRVPWVMRLPNRIPAGRVVSSNVSLLDLAPTLLGLAAPQTLADSEIGLDFSGRDLSRAALGEVEPPEQNVRYVAFGGKKGVAPAWISWMWTSPVSNLPLLAGRTEGRRKFIWNPGDKAVQLFELDQDPGELDPAELSENGSRDADEHDRFLRWFQSTDLDDAESTMTERDIEALRSLGYLQ